MPETLSDLPTASLPELGARLSLFPAFTLWLWSCSVRLLRANSRSIATRCRSNLRNPPLIGWSCTAAHQVASNRWSILPNNSCRWLTRPTGWHSKSATMLDTRGPAHLPPPARRYLCRNPASLRLGKNQNWLGAAKPQLTRLHAGVVWLLSQKPRKSSANQANWQRISDLRPLSSYQYVPPIRAIRAIRGQFPIFTDCWRPSAAQVCSLQAAHSPFGFESFTAAVRASIPHFSSAIVASCSSTLRYALCYQLWVKLVVSVMGPPL